MKSPLVFCLFLGSQSVFAQPAAHHVKPNSKVFIEPMSGFETYLMAAMVKKQVPVTIVSDRAQAEYVLGGVSEDEKAGWAKTIFVSGRSHATASVNLKEAKTGSLVWAYNVDKFASVRANQSTAEACAKHMKHDVFEKQDKW
jgi:hypothetical protein